MAAARSGFGVWHVGIRALGERAAEGGGNDWWVARCNARHGRQRPSASGQMQKLPTGKFHFVPFSEMVAM
jgi:hypothetical protein